MNRTQLLFIFLFLTIVSTLLYINRDNLVFNKKISYNLETNFDRLSQHSNIIPVAVIGSGAAGLSAALYTARAALYTVVFQGAKPGGQLTETTYVENWPGTKRQLGTDLINQTKSQAEKFGAQIVNETIVEVDFSSWPYKLITEEGTVLSALSVIIATGANPRKLGVPGEQVYWGKGVTSCAVCDAPYFKNKNVVVVGGGDSAIEEATLLASYAREITILVRGDAMRAAAAMQARLAKYPNIKVAYNTQIAEIKGNGTAVTDLLLKNSKTDQTYTMPIDGVFLAVGHIPNSAIFKPYLKTDKQGYISVGARNQHTSIPGVFAAGDISDPHYRQAGIAAGDGIKAALDAVEFLQAQGYSETLEEKLEKANRLFEVSTDINKTEPHELVKITTNQELDKLLQEKKPVVIDIGADYCPSCKVQLPIVEAVAAQLADKAYFVQVDLGQEPTELIKRFDIRQIPVVLIFNNGQLHARYDQEVISKRKLYSAVTELLHNQ